MNRRGHSSGARRPRCFECGRFRLGASRNSSIIATTSSGSRSPSQLTSRRRRAARSNPPASPHSPRRCSAWTPAAREPGVRQQAEDLHACSADTVGVADQEQCRRRDRTDVFASPASNSSIPFRRLVVKCLQLRGMRRHLEIGIPEHLGHLLGVERFMNSQIAGRSRLARSRAATTSLRTRSGSGSPLHRDVASVAEAEHIRLVDLEMLE